MSDLYITPLCLGRLLIDKSLNTYMVNVGVKFDQPMLAFLIRGGGQTLLVDSGPPPPDWCARYQRPITQAAAERLPAALQAHGVAPEDVDIVILSHLHWDHVGGLGPFTRAVHYVQRTELAYAAAPLPVHIRGYQSPQTGLRPLWDGVPLTVIHGDQVIAPGVSVLLTPGHSPGSQCVVVDTAKGRYLIATDTIPLYDNWEGIPPLQKRVPSTIHVGLEEYYASFDKIERACDFVLPGHDERVLAQERYP